MCAGIEYVFNGQRYIAMPDTQASALPVRMRGGALMFVRWGALGGRVHGLRSAPITWPAEPWIELELIKRKAFADCDPRPVRIPATRFLVFRELDAATVDGSLLQKKWLQGTLVRYGADMAVYLVVVKPPPHLIVATPWPRIVKGNFPRRPRV
jgi:hypothetical protein